MLSAIEMTQCPNLDVPVHIMRHVVQVESAYNPYAIGVVGGALVRQPGNLAEALATAKDLERRGYNFSVGLAQINRYNLTKYGLASYEQAFSICSNVQVGTRILSECHARAGGDWGKAFSCYYSGNFSTGYQHGYVDKVFASMRADDALSVGGGPVIALAPSIQPAARKNTQVSSEPAASRVDMTSRATDERPVDPAFVMAAGALESGMRSSLPSRRQHVNVPPVARDIGRGEPQPSVSQQNGGSLLLQAAEGGVAEFTAPEPVAAAVNKTAENSVSDVPQASSAAAPAADGAFVF